MEDLPPGWIKQESGGRIVFFSPAPDRIKVDCSATLKHYQRRGKFLNVSCLVFRRKKVVKNVDKKIATSEVVYHENDETSKKEEKIKADTEKMTWAVQQLTLDPLNTVDHKKELEDVAKLLNNTRIHIPVNEKQKVDEFQELKINIHILQL